MDNNCKKKVFRAVRTKTVPVPGELLVQDGQLLEAVEGDSKYHQGWYSCTNANGDTGIVRAEDIEDVTDIEKRKTILNGISQDLCKCLMNVEGRPTSTVKNIRALIGKEEFLLFDFVNDVAEKLCLELSVAVQQSCAISDEVQDSLKCIKRCFAKVDNFRSFLVTLKCKKECPAVIIDYFSKALENWFALILSSRTTTEMYNSVNEFETKDGIPGELASVIKNALQCDFYEESYSKNTKLEKCVEFIGTLWCHSEIAQVFRETVKGFIHAHTRNMETVKKTFILCEALMERFPKFAGEIKQCQQFSDFHNFMTYEEDLQEQLLASFCHKCSTNAYMDSGVGISQFLAFPPGEESLSQITRQILEEKTHKKYIEGRDFTKKLNGNLNSGYQASTQIVLMKKENSKQMVLKQFKPNQSNFIISGEFARLMECQEHDHILKASGLACKKENNNALTLTGIIMDYIELGSLFDTIFKGRLRNEGGYGEKEVILWSLQIADALKFLNSKNLIHRDVKPENILLKSKERALLADFGFARRISADSLANTNCGTLGYAAPEIKFGNYGKPVDVYSLAVTILVTAERKPPDSYHRSYSFEKSQYSWLKDLLPKMWPYKPEDRMTMDVVCEELSKIFENFRKKM